jgi:hypothetical protein
MMVAFQLDMTDDGWREGKKEGEEGGQDRGYCWPPRRDKLSWYGHCHCHCPLTGVCTIIESVRAAAISNSLLSLLKLLQQAEVARDCQTVRRRYESVC